MVFARVVPNLATSGESGFSVFQWNTNLKVYAFIVL